MSVLMINDIDAGLGRFGKKKSTLSYVVTHLLLFRRDDDLNRF